MSSDDFMRGWLAGYLDGEGCVSKSNKLKRISRVIFTSTEYELIEICVNYLNYFGIKSFVCARKNNNPKHACAYDVTVARAENIDKLSRLLSEHPTRKARAMQGVLGTL